MSAFAAKADGQLHRSACGLRVTTLWLRAEWRRCCFSLACRSTGASFSALCFAPATRSMTRSLGASCRGPLPLVPRDVETEASVAASFSLEHQPVLQSAPSVSSGKGQASSTPQCVAIPPDRAWGHGFSLPFALCECRAVMGGINAAGAAPRRSKAMRWDMSFPISRAPHSAVAAA